MDEKLLSKLSVITEEEQRILDGNEGVEKQLYTSGEEFTVDSARMLKDGQLIAVRPHTRFIRFPMHRHNYVEVVYVCRGSVTNIIGENRITVRQGELLFLNQYTRHELLPAGMDDIIINFIILPEFFDVALEMIGGNNMLANFVINTLRQDGQKGEYLYFRVSGILQIQNLMENLITSLVTGTAGDGVVNRNRINQTTMGLLFMYLLDSVQSAESLNPDQYENMIAMSTLDYIDRNYPTASLGELAQNLKLPVHTLSRMIKRSAGGNFTELLQRKRLNRAVSLLVETDEPINDIIDMVGYENHSYFHRVFKARYGMTPHAFRKKNQEMKRIRIDGGNVKKM